MLIKSGSNAWAQIGWYYNGEHSDTISNVGCHVRIIIKLKPTSEVFMKVDEEQTQ